jgi:hypothetical protein
MCYRFGKTAVFFFNGVCACREKTADSEEPAGDS